MHRLVRVGSAGTRDGRGIVDDGAGGPPISWLTRPEGKGFISLWKDIHVPFLVPGLRVGGCLGDCRSPVILNIGISFTN